MVWVRLPAPPKFNLELSTLRHVYVRTPSVLEIVEFRFFHGFDCFIGR